MARASRFRLPRTVVALGVVSLFTDISSEMIFSLLPAFLAANLPHAPLLLGAMEGVADLVSSAFKYASGHWADRTGRLKRLVLGGYGLAALTRPLMAFVTVWWQPMAIRALDRVGKGLRTSPRDAMISLTVPQAYRAQAFGFHRGMDHLGAALGALLAAALVALGIAVDRVFLIAAIPGFLGVLAVAFTREPVRPPPPEDAPASAKRAPVPRRLAWFLVPVVLFSLGNATDAFLLLRLADQGASAAMLPLSWLVLHVVKALVSYPAGQLADRLGPARVARWGWTLYALSYLALALSPSWQATFGLIALYGLYHAFAEGAEKALLSGLVPPDAQGRAFGLYHGLVGVAAPVAGLLFGAVWSGFGAAAAFLMGGAIAGLAALLLVLFLPRAAAG